MSMWRDAGIAKHYSAVQWKGWAAIDRHYRPLLPAFPPWWTPQPNNTMSKNYKGSTLKGQDWECCPLPWDMNMIRHSHVFVAGIVLCVGTVKLPWWSILSWVKIDNSGCLLIHHTWFNSQNKVLCDCRLHRNPHWCSQPHVSDIITSSRWEKGWSRKELMPQ